MRNIMIKGACQCVAAFALLFSGELYAQTKLIQAEDYSAYFDSTVGNTGGAYRPSDDVDIQATTDIGGGYNLGWIAQGEWLEYTLTLSAGTYNVNTRVASASTTGKYSLQLDGVTLGSISVGNTGGWQSWVTQTLAKINVSTTGTHKLRVIADGADFNVNWVQFEAITLSSSSLASKVSSSIFSSSSSSISSTKSSSSSSIKSSSAASVSNSSAGAASLLLQAEDYSNYLDLTTGNTGGAYRPTDNVDIQATTDVGGGYNVGWITQGEWLEYKVTLAAGTYNIKARVASGVAGGKYSVLLDGVSLASASVGNTGGWQVWLTQSVAKITLNSSGAHTLRVQADASDFNFNWLQFEAVGATSSSVSSASSSSSSDRNHYDAPKATTAPIIDGVMDSVWDAAPWAPIDVFWLGSQVPNAQDFSGRYKAMWDAGNLYLLFDITDDILMDATVNPLDRYWDDDSVEIFIDENKNGGNHQFNTSAWAYHISTLNDVVDLTNSATPKLLNSHFTVRRVSVGSKHMWEMSMRVYGEGYDDSKTNIPVTLYAGKQMGFSVCYNDNDGSAQRESMVGSVDTIGHKNNQGYIDASVFGSMTLVETLPH